MGSIPRLYIQWMGSIPNNYFDILWDWSQGSYFHTIGTTHQIICYECAQYKRLYFHGVSPNGTFLNSLGINPKGPFSLPSGPLETKVHTDSPMTNLFHFLGLVPTVHFYKGLGSTPCLVFLYHRDLSAKTLIQTVPWQIYFIFGISPNSTYL